MTPASKHINSAINLKKEGEILTANDFRGLGTEAAIRTTLSRLVIEGTLKRLAHGIYYKPKKDPELGELMPGPEEVAQQIAEKEKIKIKPSGGYALNKLGLSTQVPTRLTYITDGKRRDIKIGKIIIHFKQTTPKKMSLKGRYSSLLIQALEELDLSSIGPVTQKKIFDVLRQEDASVLKHDLQLAPARIHDYIIKLLKRKSDDRLVTIK
jgi:hypothetical protein